MSFAAFQVPMFEAQIERIRAYVEDEVDDIDRAELKQLLSRLPQDVSGEVRAELESRFAGPLTFGTAGLRGRIEAGESRMNRATVVRATAGLAEHLLESVPEAQSRGVVLGRDARNRSEAFQEDAAAVLLAQGFRVFWLEGPMPTPVVPFGVLRLGAAAGIVITASHNPPADNGYKVYWDHGAQIAPPTDAHIAEAIQRQPGARRIPRTPRAEAGDLVVSASDLVEAYLQSLDRLCLAAEVPVRDLSIVYTAMHGVGGRIFRETLARRGFETVSVVEDQFDPDPNFPTVAFPNPEEPGALDLARKKADSVGADLVLAHDPDADRLAALVRCPRRGWVALSGNDIGVLLARYLIDHVEPGNPKRLVVNTIVSSRLLGRMARDLSVRYEETLTGFKHIAERMRSLETQEGLLPLMGYEEALGYAVSRSVHDKDGISSGLVLAEMAAVSKSRGRTLLDELEAIHRAHGLFVGCGRSVVDAETGGAERIAGAMARLRAAPLDDLARLGVEEIWDLQTGLRRSVSSGLASGSRPGLEGDVLVFELRGGGRAAVRPSGTEPKLKLYLEMEASWPTHEEHDEAANRSLATLARVERGLLEIAGYANRGR